jgi:putative membrane protein
MAGLVIRILITTFGLWLASIWVSGVSIEGNGTFLLAAILLGIVNAIVRPLVLLLTLPVTIITVGLFILVINAGMFALVAAMLDNFVVTGFFDALFGSLIVSITSIVASLYIGPSGRYQVMIVNRRD